MSNFTTSSAQHEARGTSTAAPPDASTSNGKTPSAAVGTTPKHRYQLVRFQEGLRNVDRKICQNHPVFSFLVLPERDDQEGLFPRGELGLIAGASGSWKTTVFLAFVKAWTNGEKF